MVNVTTDFREQGSKRTSAPVHLTPAEHEAIWREVVETYVPTPSVYFIGAPNGLVKIGFTKDFDARFDQLICMSPVVLEVLAITDGARRLEGEYHARFKKYRRHGEWFERVAEIEAEIARLNRGGHNG